ncbi:hypothetical protein DB32_001044 [Sandaracinus amylolyticus]|uniref:Uncharacterized protein n=1 Tax=Sandaracinus amylolyticus TaxID=927083 RepID=A0A0F6YHD2_9BACT|nr:hypothetical protein DB32_001044 [Sandaracinus amylolyticus]
MKNEHTRRQAGVERLSTRNRSWSSRPSWRARVSGVFPTSKKPT